jgi:hypothetical protein
VLEPRIYYPLQDAARFGHPDDLRILGRADHRLTPQQVQAALGNIHDRHLVARLENNDLIRRPGGTTAAAFALAGAAYYAYMDVADPVPLTLISRNITVKTAQKAGAKPLAFP